MFGFEMMVTHASELRVTQYNLNLIIISKLYKNMYSVTKKGPCMVHLTLGSNWEVG